jgi:hypothetical protein
VEERISGGCRVYMPHQEFSGRLFSEVAIIKKQDDPNAARYKNKQSRLKTPVLVNWVVHYIHYD